MAAMQGANPCPCLKRKETLMEEWLEKRVNEKCPMRTDLGNCLPVGGFCTSVPEEFCEAVHNAYNRGFADAATFRRIKERKQ